MTAFGDRRDAGDALAHRLADRAGRADVIVLGLPRGGVIVAARVAERLRAPLHVVVVRKLGTPGHVELAMGALAVWGTHVSVVRNEQVLARARVSDAAFDAARSRELDVARRRAAQWGRQPPDITGAEVIVVDDGLATGATMHAAVGVLRAAGARRIVAAVPVGAPEELRRLGREVDELVYVLAPSHFRAVGAHYRDFGQVDDATVARELRNSQARCSPD